MTLKTGFALLTGLTLGMCLAAELQAKAYARQFTALHIATCTKADKASVR
jgi:hypothetical protein